MALFVPLAVTWPDDDPVMEVGLDGAGLHAITLCLAKRMETDGWVTRRLLRRYDATDELIDRLVTAGLLEADDGRVRPCGWLKHNPSQAAIAAKRASKKEAGKRGNHSRWHSGEFETCRLCQEPSEQVIATSDRTASDCESQTIATVSPYSESERERECDGSGSHDATALGFAAPTPPVIAELRRQLQSVPDERTHADQTDAAGIA